MKKGTIRNLLNRILWAGEKEDYTVVVIDRLSPTGLREIPAMLIARVDSTYIYLNDALEAYPVIPLHRVVSIKRGGRVIWSRTSPRK